MVRGRNAFVDRGRRRTAKPTAETKGSCDASLDRGVISRVWRGDVVVIIIIIRCDAADVDMHMMMGLVGG